VKYQRVLTRILKKIKPTAKQEKEMLNLATKTLEITKEEAKKFNAKPILAGSITRNTWLPSKPEFEIFVAFPESLPENKLEEYGLALGKKVAKRLKGKIQLKYAQHPYVTVLLGAYSIDIVPCYALKSAEKIKSAVDRTPFHVEYLNKKFSPELSDDVRLLKQFLKANGLYGADAKTQGFSGYACDLLVLNYKSFLNVLKTAVKWKPKEIIDIEHYWPKEDYKRLRKKFKDEALILIDPVDKNRNVTAAVSATNFFKFKKIAQEFLKKPKESFFFAKKPKPLATKDFQKIMKKRGTKLLAVSFKPPDVVPDILWPQLRRFTERLKDILHEYEFRVHRFDCWTDEDKLAVVLLEMEVWQMPNINERIGPLVFDIANSENFIKKYKKVALTGPYVRDNRWRFEVQREWTNAKKKLEDSLNKSKKILMAKGVPSHIAQQIVKGFKVLDENGIKKLLRNEEFASFLRKYFEADRLIP
jgi:tRNA nucleotidyltransferase (CCA-adding enzyme)